MTAEAALYGVLTTTEGVTALVGTRIYPNRIPADVARPALAYQLISRVPVQTHDNAQPVDADRFQLTILGETYATAKSVGAACRAALNGQRQTDGDGFTFVAVLLNERDDHGDTVGFDVVRQDYRIIYRP